MLKEDVVIERTNSWRDRFRKLLVRDEKKSGSYFAVVVVVCLGCFIIIYLIIIYRRIIFGQALSREGKCLKLGVGTTPRFADLNQVFVASLIVK